MRPAKFLCFAPVAKRKGIRDFFFALSSFFVSFVSFAFFQFIANKCFLNLLRLCWGLCVPHRPAFFRVSDEKLRPIHDLAHGKKRERKKKEKIFSAFDSNYRINHKCEYPFSSIRTRGIVRPKRDRLHGLKKRSKRGKQPKTTPTAWWKHECMNIPLWLLLEDIGPHITTSRWTLWSVGFFCLSRCRHENALALQAFEWSNLSIIQRPLVQSIFVVTSLRQALYMQRNK